MKHRYSGWPGAYCLGCGREDPAEAAIAEENFTTIDDPNGPRLEFPGLVETECPGAEGEDI